MRELVSNVEQTILRHKLFQPHQFILVAVSGGLDSMVLLHVLYQLADKHGWMPAVAHFNHQLRGSDSDKDAEFVANTASQLGLKFVCEKGDVREFARAEKLSIEMAARELRHDFLARASVMLGIKSVALAHHADDQVELFFMRLLRGAGGEGLSGMRWKSASPSNRQVELVRPFLNCFRKELQRFAEEEGIAFRIDATNDLLDAERNLVRHELLPILAEKFQPAVARTTLRVMEVLSAESDFVRQAAQSCLHGQNSAGFDGLHIAVQRQLLRLELVKLDVVPEFDLVERLRTGLCREIMVQPGVSIWRDQEGRIHSRGVSPAAFNFDQTTIELSPKGGEIAFGGVTISWQVERLARLDRPNEESNGKCECFDAAKVGTNVVLRYWRPGDRFQPIGMATPVKLQNLFTNRKISSEHRRALIVAATAAGEIFWVEGLRISAQFKLDKETKCGLKWSWQRE